MRGKANYSNFGDMLNFQGSLKNTLNKILSISCYLDLHNAISFLILFFYFYHGCTFLSSKVVNVL